MSRRRWSLWLGPPVALLAVALVLSRFQPGAEAGGRKTAPPAGACAASPVSTDGAGRPERDAGVGSWWRLQDRIDAAGVMTGRALAVGRGGAQSIELDLPVESGATGPMAGVVVMTVDDGQTSEIRLVSAEHGCAWLVHTTPDVVRGAILDPTDGSVLAHLVSRATRDDLGTWRVGAPAALAEPVLVAPSLPADQFEGPTFATDLRLDAAGRLLAVQSCGDATCVARLFDLTNPDRAPTVLQGDQGSMVGFGGGHLVTWATCFGFPCALLSWDAAMGTASTLLIQAESAAITPDGRYVVATFDSSKGRTMRIDLAAGTRALIRGIGRAERPLGVGAGATSGLQLAADEVGLASAGTIPRRFRPAAAEVIP